MQIKIPQDRDLRNPTLAQKTRKNAAPGAGSCRSAVESVSAAQSPFNVPIGSVQFHTGSIFQPARRPRKLWINRRFRLKSTYDLALAQTNRPVMGSLS